MNKQGMLAQLIGAFVAIGIGLLLFTMVSDQWTTMVNDCNNSSSYSYNDSNNPFCKMVNGEDESASALLIKWVPYLFLATIIFISFSVAWRAFAGSDYGSFDSDDDEDDEDEDEDEDYEEDEEDEEDEDVKTDELEETTKDEKKYKQVMATKDDDELGYTGKSSSHYEKQRQKYMKKMQRFKDKKIVSEDKLNKTEFD